MTDGESAPVVLRGRGRGRGVADVVRFADGVVRPVPGAFSAPASLGHAVLSRGVEERAGFAPHAARQTLRVCGAYRLVVGCELVSAVRAHQQDLEVGVGPAASRALGPAESVLDEDQADRLLTDDVTAAARLLNRFTDILRGSEA